MTSAFNFKFPQRTWIIRIKFGVIYCGKNLVVFFGHRCRSNRHSIRLGDVVVERIHVDFDFVVIISAASIHVDAGVEMTMTVCVGRRRPRGGGGGRGVERWAQGGKYHCDRCLETVSRMKGESVIYCDCSLSPKST